MKERKDLCSGKIMSFAYKYNYPQVARDSGFQLRNYKDGPLDWRLMGSVEVERILREQCLEQVDSVLEHLSEAPLGSMLETNILDGAIAKYFVLSQFSIQYLLFCRKFLEETVADLRETHGSSQMEVATLKRSLSEANNEILQLHKRITQMEAIHEVIYPCHLCTKNFVSNDALNLHISRKHSATNAKQDERTETPVTSAKERENDLTLINTIKLELEIKHLKERLNNAERKIKEKDVTPTSNRSDRDNPEKRPTNSISIGIQSNLSDIKDHDEQSEYFCKHCSENTGQIGVIQNKLQDLHEWKEEQKIQTSDFLAAINSKLKDLTHAIEITRSEQEPKLQKNGTVPPATSIDDLDALLSRKVEDIGKTTAAKLEDIVSKMELNYTSKLQDLEKELVKKQSTKSYIPVQHKIIADTKRPSSRDEIHDSQLKDSSTNFPTEVLPTIVKSVEEEEVLPRPPSSEKSSSLSNHTFVKTKSDNNLARQSQEEQKPNLGEEYTDVSDETLEDDDSVSNTKLPKATTLHGKPGIKSVYRQKCTTGDLSEFLAPDQKMVAPLETSPKPKPVTRKESRMLVNSRLSALGINMKTKSLTQSSMKRVSNELSERRSKLKEKHPNFYATRNKIKIFVDKLCSSKMPENAQALLKATRPVKHKDKSTNRQNMSYTPSSDEEDAILDGRRHTKASTPLEDSSNSIHNFEFKHRLESILASPIRKPDEHHLKSVIHHQEEQTDKPIPMPRKRVMFNQQKDTKLSGTLSISESESEHLPKQYHQKPHVHRNS